MIMKRLLISVVVLAALAGCSEPGQDMADGGGGPGLLADFGALDEGWNTIEAGGEAVCSDGSPYHFHVRPGDPGKLMFYLEGGGACWMGENCDPELRPSYTINLADTDPAGLDGIFAFDNERNPVADYTVVMVPYCSADVFLGDREQVYETPAMNGREAGEVHIHHRGHANVRAAMDWVFDHMYAPRDIFVTGSSAGSIPSPFYAVELSGQYRNARTIQLGDGSGGYRGLANFSPYEVWGTDEVISGLEYMQDIDAGEFNFHQLYMAAAWEDSSLRLASFDTVEDRVQKDFLTLGGTPAESLQPLLAANLEEIRQEVPDFRYFVADGEMHTILRRPELYTLDTSGVAFVDWLNRLVNGQRVQNVLCEACSGMERAQLRFSQIAAP